MRDAADALSLELHGWHKPARFLRQDDQAIRVELNDVNAVVAAIADAAVELAEVRAGDRVYHA